jgi:pyruvate ferredoxin oxidoreductase, alpha subunit (EC 1.2.7.1)
MQWDAHRRALSKIETVAREFAEQFGRWYGGLIDTYHADDAEVIIVTMGSVIGTIKDCIDDMRSEGLKVGLVKIRSYRPFPTEAVRRALKDAEVVAVIEKDVTVGNEGALLTDLKAALYNTPTRVPVIGFPAGLGGRDITVRDIRRVVDRAIAARDRGIEAEMEFLSLREDLL